MIHFVHLSILTLSLMVRITGAFWVFASQENAMVLNVISLLVVHCLSLFSTLVCISAADKIVSCDYILIKCG